jgi:tetratricopeptide (TPR) repeat protein
VAILSRRQLRAALLGVTAGLLITAVVITWSLTRRLPVAETRRFLTAPVEVGDQPAPAPPDAAPPADVAQGYARAEYAFGEGRYAEAARDFAWVVAQDPGGPQAGPAQWNLTRSRLRSGDANGALAALDDLLRHHVGYLGEQAPGLRQGLELMQRSDLPAALAAFQGMIHDQPDSEFVPLAYALIARIHWAHGEPMETVRAFARMFASVKDPVPAYGQLAQSLERYANGDTEAPERFRRLARDGSEGFRDIYEYLAARSLLEQDRFTAAHDALEELRRRDPHGDFSHIVDLEHAWNLLRHQRAAEALAIFERLEKTPAPEEVRAFDDFFDLRAELPLGIARCQLALGHHAEAVAAFERALAAAPRSIYAVDDQVGMAMAYEQLGQLDRAAGLLRTVIQEHPDEPKLWALRQQLARIEERLTAAR